MISIERFSRAGHPGALIVEAVIVILERIVSRRSSMDQLIHYFPGSRQSVCVVCH